ncbi:MAG: CAAX prenyl protease-related protein [Planctomycetota bacterium]
MSDFQNTSQNPTDGLEDYRKALPFVLPLFVHLLLATFLTPDVAGSFEGNGFENSIRPEMTAEAWTYIGLLATQVVAAIFLVVIFREPIFKSFPLRLSWWSVLIGTVGFFVWIGICYPQLEGQVLTLLGFDFTRPAFNPFDITDPAIRTLFLAVRFSVLCLVVPVIEELLVRGWLIRWIESPDWETVSLKELSWRALIAASIYGVVAHPMEAIAAFVWFGLVTWMMNRNGNFWDCVVAHGVTNLILGLYVVNMGQWHLW